MKTIGGIYLYGKKRKIVTVSEAQELNIWSNFCEREGWDEKRLEEMGVKGDMRFAIDEDLFKKEEKKGVN